MSPYQDEKDGVSAGGKWIEFQSEDKMTGAKRVRFELLSNNYLKEDPTTNPESNSTAAMANMSAPSSILGPAGKARLPGILGPAENVGYGPH